MKKLWDVVKGLTFKSVSQLPDVELKKISNVITPEPKKLIIPKSQLKIITPKQSRILDIAVQTKEISAKDADSLVFMAKPFVQTTLPHRDPGIVHEWYRQNGMLTMSVRAGYGNDLETGERICYGIPYGTVPRLLIIFFSSEVIKTGNRIIKLGNNLSEFMLKIGLNPRGGTGRNSPTFRIKKQLMSLLNSMISFEYDKAVNDTRVKSFMHMNIANKGVLKWYVKNGNVPYPVLLEEDLEGSWIGLSETFFDCLSSCAVPLDARVVEQIKQSPLALDLYAWMIHRTYSNSTTADTVGKTSAVSYEQLHNQFGSNYGTVKNFKQKIKPILRQIRSMSHNLCLEEASGRLIIKKK
jgi:hypothetical protein